MKTKALISQIARTKPQRWPTYRRVQLSQQRSVPPTSTTSLFSKWERIALQSIKNHNLKITLFIPLRLICLTRYGCFSEKGYHMGWPDTKTNYKFVVHPREEIPIKSWLLNMWEITIITTKVFHVVVLVWKPIFVCQMWRFSIAILWHEPATIKQLTRIPTTLSYFHCKHFIY